MPSDTKNVGDTYTGGITHLHSKKLMQVHNTESNIKKEKRKKKHLHMFAILGEDATLPTKNSFTRNKKSKSSCYKSSPVQVTKNDNMKQRHKLYYTAHFWK